MKYRRERQISLMIFRHLSRPMFTTNQSEEHEETAEMDEQILHIFGIRRYSSRDGPYEILRCFTFRLMPFISPILDVKDNWMLKRCTGSGKFEWFGKWLKF